MSRTVPAAEAQQNFQSILDEIASSHVEILVTRDGMPVARVGPVEPRSSRSLEELRGSVQILGDIVAPADEEWDAAR